MTDETHYTEIGDEAAKRIAHFFSTPKPPYPILEDIREAQRAIEKVYHYLRDAQRSQILNSEDERLLQTVFNAYEWLEEIHDNIYNDIWDLSDVVTELEIQAEKHTSSPRLLAYEPRFKRDD